MFQPAIINTLDTYKKNKKSQQKIEHIERTE